MSTPDSAVQAVGAAGAVEDPHYAKRWWILAVLGIAQLMVVLDATIVNIALPHAQAALGFSNNDRQWIVTGYSLAFGSLLLLGGRIADLFGRKRIFVIGVIGFAAASAFGGAAQNFGMLLDGPRRAGRVRRAARPGRAVAAHHHLHRPGGAGQGDRHLRRRSPAAARRSGCCSAAS